MPPKHLSDIQVTLSDVVYVMDIDFYIILPDRSIGMPSEGIEIKDIPRCITSDGVPVSDERLENLLEDEFLSIENAIFDRLDMEDEVMTALAGPQEEDALDFGRH